MKVFSAKNPWRIELLLILSCASGRPAPALTHEGAFRFESRLGYHLVEPIDLAIHRHQAEIAATATLDPRWQIVAAARGYVEGAYGANSRYQGAVIREATHDL